VRKNLKYLSLMFVLLLASASLVAAQEKYAKLDTADTEQFPHGLAPELEYQMWDGVGHFLFLDRPKEFNAAVIAFLDQKKLLQ
jgi:pimeloyl-ACP methyl ester carboxylesterase